MAFVNEYISEKDAKKYNYFALMNAYNLDRITRFPNLHPRGLFKYDWVIDRERDICFFRAGYIYEDSWIDRPTRSGVEIYILSIKGSLIEFELYLGEGSSKTYKADPYIVFWEIQKIRKLTNSEVDKKTILSLLDEALQIYVRKGMYNKMKNPKVTLRELKTALVIEENKESLK